MKTIYKYAFEVTDSITVAMHAGAEILTVQLQRGTPCIWALVDKDMPSVNRRLRLIGTGHPITDNPGKYLGTFQEMGGALVFHLFDQGEEEE